MSENVTHTAVVEDCLNLMLASDQICAAFKQAGRVYSQFFQFGSVTRSGDKFTVSLLEKYRDRWEADSDNGKLGYKLAFVLGWLCHRAADRQMKVVFREAEPESLAFPTDCSIYHDAFIYNRLYKDHEDTLYRYRNAHFENGMESLPAAAHVKTAEAARAFRFQWQRFLLQMQTFITQTEPLDAWLDKLHARHQEQIIGLERYAEAVLSPDPLKVERFITDTQFYREEDPVLRLCERLRAGERPSPQEVEAAVAAEATSQYAQAVVTGFGYLRSASAFFEGRIDQETLRDQLDVGKKGRDGLAV